MIEKFREWVDNKHDYARDWKKRTGGKMVGYLCTYAPEEIFYAAGVVPVRIYGSHEASSVVEPHIFGMFCPYCRDCLAQGLEGKYEYLNGIMLAQGCMHMRQTFWSWQKHVPVDYSYYLLMPHGIQTAGRYEYLRGELGDFKRSLEEWLGITITDKDLDRGIEICNTNRRLLEQVYEFRKQENPAITGLEAMELVLSSQMMDKREHNRALEELLKELPQRKLERETGTRLMIIGSENDDREFMNMVEEGMSLPATVVMEDQCTGSRYFLGEVIPQQDRLMAIAKRYIDRVPCPSKDWPERKRFPHLMNMIKEYNVEGVILQQEKFCDPHELDMPSLTTHLKDKGVPTYFLEFDITVPVGQFRTRVEAFLETLTMDIL